MALIGKSNLEIMKYFSIPVDMRNDIVYCQRTLQIYLKVYEVNIYLMN